jgi:hypothetical protein
MFVSAPQSFFGLVGQSSSSARADRAFDYLEALVRHAPSHSCVTDVAAPGEVRGSCTQQVRSTNNYCEISLNDTNIHYFQDKS